MKRMAKKTKRNQNIGASEELLMLYRVLRFLFDSGTLSFQDGKTCIMVTVLCKSYRCRLYAVEILLNR